MIFFCSHDRDQGEVGTCHKCGHHLHSITNGRIWIKATAKPGRRPLGPPERRCTIQRCTEDNG